VAAANVRKGCAGRPRFAAPRGTSIVLFCCQLRSSVHRLGPLHPGQRSWRPSLTCRSNFGSACRRPRFGPLAACIDLDSTPSCPASGPRRPAVASRQLQLERGSKFKFSSIHRGDQSGPISPDWHEPSHWPALNSCTFLQVIWSTGHGPAAQAGVALARARPARWPMLACADGLCVGRRRPAPICSAAFGRPAQGLTISRQVSFYH
jgi:hypothetical protein